MGIAEDESDFGVDMLACSYECLTHVLNPA